MEGGHLQRSDMVECSAGSVAVQSLSDVTEEARKYFEHPGRLVCDVIIVVCIRGL